MIKDAEFEKICHKIKEAQGHYSFSPIDNKAHTYYMDVDNMLKMNCDIVKYDAVNTPVELKNLFLEIWKTSSDIYLEELAVVLSVAAFKNKEKACLPEKEISPYIYEFG